jgi:electron-transferring-flavoprotein dehydrogenase
VSTHDTLHTDILVVGGGPAGLATAIHFRRRLAELRRERSGLPDFTVTVIEKAREFGVHCLSGAIVDVGPLARLLPGRELPGFAVPCAEEQLAWLTPKRTFASPWIPRVLSQRGNVSLSLSRLVRWLAEAAEAEGVQLAPGFAAAAPLVEDGRVVGVRTGDSGRDRLGRPKASFQAGADVRARVTVVAEGARGSLARQLDAAFHLSSGRPAPVYALGMKELWQVPSGRVKPGQVLHTLGFPLKSSVYGGGFLYGHADDQVSVGLIVGLDYQDPCLDPYLLFQRFKRHARIRRVLEAGRVLGYGARTLNEGGWYGLPKLWGNGFLLVGESAGLLDTLRLKGVHLAIESGILAAEAALDALCHDDVGEDQLSIYGDRVASSRIRAELWRARNFRQAFRSGRTLGLVQAALQGLSGGRGLIDPMAHSRGYAEMRRVADVGRRHGAVSQADDRTDEQLTFDRTTALAASRVSHEEDQPTHLVVADPGLCAVRCRDEYDNPCQRFCPAAVYELVVDHAGATPRLLIHASNCLHCKTCEIMDPYQIITWVPPEAGGGPFYEAL